MPIGSYQQYNLDATPLLDHEAEALLILLHRYHVTVGSEGYDELPEDLKGLVEDLVMSMNPTTDLADAIRKDLGV